jgi:hypothetical protein
MSVLANYEILYSAKTTEIYQFWLSIEIYIQPKRTKKGSFGWI